jgi:hypothetical protein
MDADAEQRATLGMLLELHPRMLSLDELSGRLADVDVDRSVAGLQDDGLATRLGDLIGATRAAVRGDQLQL